MSKEQITNCLHLLPTKHPTCATKVFLQTEIDPLLEQELQRAHLVGMTWKQIKDLEETRMIRPSLLLLRQDQPRADTNYTAPPGAPEGIF